MSRPSGLRVVGREVELDRLRMAIGAAHAGRASTVILAGDHGMGKTLCARRLWRVGGLSPTANWSLAARPCRP